MGAAQGLAAAGLAAGGLVGLRLPLPPMAFPDLAPLERTEASGGALPVRAATGPVVVTVEYRIDAVDAPRFLVEMTERARIRRRDGARSWTLLHDLEDDSLWCERYSVATWRDYLLLRQRRTKADLSVTERILALHRGEAPPRVRRMLERRAASQHGPRADGPGFADAPSPPAPPLPG